MAKSTGAHSAGIEALPKWDRSNPTTYNYDWRNYDRADYAAFKQARLAQQQKEQKASVARNKQIMKEANKAITDTIKREIQKKPGPTRADIEKAAEAGRALHADLPSTVFASLEWRNGIATAEFYRGGDLVYEYEMELDEFLDWAGSDSLGHFFNAEIR